MNEVNRSEPGECFRKWIATVLRRFVYSKLYSQGTGLTKSASLELGFAEEAKQAQEAKEAEEEEGVGNVELLTHHH